MDCERGESMGDRGRFAQTLARMKADGSNLLIVGSNSLKGHTAVCHRLLGDDGVEPRYRVFVTNGAVRSSFEMPTACVNAVRTIDYAEWAASTDTGPPKRQSSLATFGVAIVDAIDELAQTTTDLSSSELRLCVDAIAPLLDEYGPEAVFRFVHTVSARVDDVDGMGHYHLPLERNHEVVSLLVPLFDAVVEVRSTNGRVEQRWDLLDSATSTDWLTL